MSHTGSELLKSINPATGNVVGEVPVTAAGDINKVIERARAALPRWRAKTLEERAAALAPAGAKLLERSTELGELMSAEMGKPVKKGVGEAKECGSTLDATLAEIVAALQPEVVEDNNVRSVIHRDPFGVCAAITPWNFPLAMPHWMVVPALMAGNTVVMKPSEETPLTAQAYVDILNETLPDGVLQVVHGADDQGKALVKAADLVAFTGSREAGKHILAAASASLTRVVLELGGKDPMIVLDDADVARAARFAVNNSFRNSGQVCVSTERIYVDEAIADEFESEVVRLTKDYKIGPMVNARQKDHVLAQLEDAVSKGATVLTGNENHKDNFVTPTVLSNLDDEMSIMRDETFGPVACIVRFSDVDEAVRRANDTPFGLGATVFGQDEDRAADVARRLTAGMIGINKSCGGAEGTPWVGAQESGYGFHSSPEGHRQFAQARVISLKKS